jgi:hypothetical protein
MREAVIGLPGRLPKAWAPSMLDALVQDLRGPSSGFTEQVGAIVKPMAYPSATGNPWQSLLAALRRDLLPCLVSDAAMASRAEDLLHQAQVLVDEAVEDAQIHHRLLIERRRRSLSGATELLSAAFDLESLAQAMSEAMPRLGVQRLLVLENVSPVGRRIFAHDPRRTRWNSSASHHADDGIFLPGELLPPDRIYRGGGAALFKEEPWGTRSSRWGPGTRSPTTFGALRVRISGASGCPVEAQVCAGQLARPRRWKRSASCRSHRPRLQQPVAGHSRRRLASLAEPGSDESA